MDFKIHGVLLICGVCNVGLEVGRLWLVGLVVPMAASLAARRGQLHEPCREALLPWLSRSRRARRAATDRDDHRNDRQRNTTQRASGEASDGARRHRAGRVLGRDGNRCDLLREHQPLECRNRAAVVAVRVEELGILLLVLIRQQQ